MLFIIHSDHPQKKTLLLLVFFHLSIIAASNYLVQLPFTLFGFHTTWGAFTFPFVFLATDLSVRLCGASLARQVIALAMMPALLVSYLVSVIFLKGDFQGISSLLTFDPFVARITLASFAAYALGQLLDVTIFNYLRTIRQWWVAPACSTIVGNGIDTLAFFSIAFAGSSDLFMAENWQEIALVDYSFKLFISLLLFLPLYGTLLNLIARNLSRR